MKVMGIGAANWLVKGSGTLLLSCRTNSIPSLSKPIYFPPHKNNNTLFTITSVKIGHWNKGTSTKLHLNLYCTAPSNDTTSDEETNKLKEAANTLDIRVGKILKAWRHQEADSLYVEEVDVGEPEPRIICSGLVNYIPLHHLQERNVIVLANLKPRNMRGVKSNGMLMAASDASHENVELLEPPEGSVPGERIWFGSADEKENLPDAASPNQVAKKKIWEQVQPHLITDSGCVAALGVHTMRTSTGVVVSQTLKDARIS